ncbi:MAG TPA: hypothetical protein VFC56_12475 [Stellaceae bacterium]|nr:hypothetical protein [Stellaceae bacterium]
MPKNTQLLWIAEAEARRLREFTLIQHAASEPQISVVAAMHGSARFNRWRRLIAGLTPATASAPAAPVGLTTASEADAAKAPEYPAPAGSAVADLAETSFEAQRC